MKYTLQTNKLTQPMSYYASPQPEVIGDEEIIENVALRTGMAPTTISSVLKGLRNSIEHYLVSGKAITLENFVRFSLSLPGRIDNYEENASKESLEVSVVISNDIRDNVRFGITLEKMASVVKVPSIAYTSYEYNEATGLAEIRGNYLDFSKLASDEGVYFYNTKLETEVRAEEYGSVTNTKCVFSTPAFENNAFGFCEWKLKVKARYTAGGNIREGEFNSPLRSKRTIVTGSGGGSVTSGNVFITNYDLTQYSMITGVSYTEPGKSYIYKIGLSPLEPGEPAVGDIVKLWVESNEVQSDVVDIELTGSAITVDIPCNVASVDETAVLESVSVQFTNLVSLANIANRYYGGVIYEAIAMTDNIA